VSNCLATDTTTTETTPSTGGAPGVASEEAAVRAVWLSKTYSDGTTAVHALDLEIRRGEVVALLGPKGAGKSTTVGVLTTSVVPTAAQAQVAGSTSGGTPRSPLARSAWPGITVTQRQGRCRNQAGGKQSRRHSTHHRGSAALNAALDPAEV
jgi:ABC-type transport system involved in cytochrome bd biosynthesis fused ATPase/permease subunit